MVSKNAVSVMRGAALWAATFVSVVAVAWIGSAAYVSFTTTDYAYPRTGGTTNLNATMWNKLIDNVQDIGTRTSAITASSGSYVGIGTSNPQAQLEIVWTSMRQTNYGSNANVSVVRANGTLSSPSAVSAFERIGGYFFAGYDGSDFANVAAITGYASEHLTTASHGSIIGFETTSSGANTRTERMRIDQSGYVGIGTSSPIFKLDVNGSANAASQCIGGSCLSAWSGIVWGSYTTATSKCAAVNNPATWSTSCPSWFTGVVTGRGLCDQSDPSMYVTYLCVKN